MNKYIDSEWSVTLISHIGNALNNLFTHSLNQSPFSNIHPIKYYQCDAHAQCIDFDRNSCLVMPDWFQLDFDLFFFSPCQYDTKNQQWIYHPKNNESCWIYREPRHVAYWNFTSRWYSPIHTIGTKMNAIAWRHAVWRHSEWRHILDSVRGETS